MCPPGRSLKIQNPLTALHKQEQISIAYPDVLYLLVKIVPKMLMIPQYYLTSLVWLVQPQKFSFMPTQVLVILGFVINSVPGSNLIASKMFVLNYCELRGK